jgi:hypothetical protein
MSNLKYAYGLTPEQFQDRLSAQGGTCLICDGDITGYLPTPVRRRAKACVDHCHTTKKVRGLLCVACNAGLGHFKDNTTVMARAISYLEGSV